MHKKSLSLAPSGKSVSIRFLIGGAFSGVPWLLAWLTIAIAIGNILSAEGPYLDFRPVLIAASLLIIAGLYFLHKRIKYDPRSATLTISRGWLIPFPTSRIALADISGFEVQKQLFQGRSSLRAPRRTMALWQVSCLLNNGEKRFLRTVGDQWNASETAYLLANATGKPCTGTECTPQSVARMRLWTKGIPGIMLLLLALVWPLPPLAHIGLPDPLLAAVLIQITLLYLGVKWCWKGFRVRR